MSLLSLTVPKEYGYVLATATSTAFVAMWLSMRVGGFRRKTGITYPQRYADSGHFAAAKTAEDKQALYLFNCAQRAHGNFDEAHLSTVLSLLIAGLRMPVAAASVGGIWVVARVVYAIGYTRADKERGRGRRNGYIAGVLAQLGLMGMAAWTSVKLIL